MKREKNTKIFKSKHLFNDVINFLTGLSYSVKKSSLTNYEKSILFLMLKTSDAINQIENEFFELLRYSDGKYTLIVRKDLNDIVTITFNINPNYNGIRYE